MAFWVRTLQIQEVPCLSVFSWDAAWPAELLLHSVFLWQLIRGYPTTIFVENVPLWSTLNLSPFTLIPCSLVLNPPTLRKKTGYLPYHCRILSEAEKSKKMLMHFFDWCEETRLDCRWYGCLRTWICRPSSQHVLEAVVLKCWELYSGFYFLPFPLPIVLEFDLNVLIWSDLIG